MSEDQAIGMVGLLGVLAFVGVGLARRRLPGRTWLTMALLWGAIIALVWAAAPLELRWTR